MSEQKNEAIEKVMELFESCKTEEALEFWNGLNMEKSSDDLEIVNNLYEIYSKVGVDFKQLVTNFPDNQFFKSIGKKGFKEIIDKIGDNWLSLKINKQTEDAWIFFDGHLQEQVKLINVPMRQSIAVNNIISITDEVFNHVRFDFGKLFYIYAISSCYLEQLRGKN